MRRYALRDDQWDRIKDILPGREGHVGVTAKDDRLFVEAVIYRYRAGIPWRDLPERVGDHCVCFLSGIRRNSRALFLTDPTCRLICAAIWRALSPLRHPALSFCNSSSVHTRSTLRSDIRGLFAPFCENPDNSITGSAHRVSYRWKGTRWDCSASWVSIATNLIAASRAPLAGGAFLLLRRTATRSMKSIKSFIWISSWVSSLLERAFLESRFCWLA